MKKLAIAVFLVISVAFGVSCKKHYTTPELSASKTIAGHYELGNSSQTIGPNAG
jgi:hypothetical protein